MVSVPLTKIPSPDFCCYGFPLRTATLIIGWLSLAAGVLALLISVGNGINPITGTGFRKIETYRCESSSGNKVCTLENNPSGGFSSESYYQGGYGSVTYERKITVSDSEIEHWAVVLTMLLGVAGLVLIVAVHMKKASYMVPFMVAMILAALCGISIVLLTVTGFKTELTQSLRCFKENGWLVWILVALVLDAYFLVVLNSYYRKLLKTGPEATPPAEVASFGVKSSDTV